MQNAAPAEQEESHLSTFGFEVIDNLLTPAQVAEVIGALEELDVTGAGTRRLLDLAWCRELVATIKRNDVMQRLLPQDAVAIQCTLFEKSSRKNWLVAPHQDLVVPVKSRVSHPDLGIWSEKEGQLFVQAPAEILENLLAVRISLDDSDKDNGALRVTAGSHTAGRLDQLRAAQVKERVGETVCNVRNGSALVMRPLLLHASSKAASPRQRRVLHVLFAPQTAGYGLEWQHSV